MGISPSSQLTQTQSHSSLGTAAANIISVHGCHAQRERRKKGGWPTVPLQAKGCAVSLFVTEWWLEYGMLIKPPVQFSPPTHQPSIPTQAHLIPYTPPNTIEKKIEIQAQAVAGGFCALDQGWPGQVESIAAQMGSFWFCCEWDMGTKEKANTNVTLKCFLLIGVTFCLVSRNSILLRCLWNNRTWHANHAFGLAVLYTARESPFLGMICRNEFSSPFRITCSQASTKSTVIQSSQLSPNPIVVCLLDCRSLLFLRLMQCRGSEMLFFLSLITKMLVYFPFELCLTTFPPQKDSPQIKDWKLSLRLKVAEPISFTPC